VAAHAWFHLSKLAVWWLRLGIGIGRIKPGHPQQNGRHERMHLTLKKETTKPAGPNFLQQQARFDDFIEIFNNERPHEALDMKCPAEVYQPSTRTYRGLPELSGNSIGAESLDWNRSDSKSYSLMIVPDCRPTGAAAVLEGGKNMGIERASVSTKLSPENIEFLDELIYRLRPYEVSQSSLVNTLIRIIRQLEAMGKISLEPKQLQATLGNRGGGDIWKKHAEISEKRAKKGAK